MGLFDLKRSSCGYCSPIHFAVMVLCLFLLGSPAWAATCLYVSSYHKGYEWNDGIERGIESVLQDKCKLDRFYMDTKRNKSKDFGEKAALQAKAYIEKTNPDVVIAADDNASRYLIQPYFKDAELPIVFCGINHTVKPYGYPYSNATGMIEISPVRTLLKYIKSIMHGKLKHGVYLAADVITNHKEFSLNQEVYSKEGIRLTPIYVKKMSEWLAAYYSTQKKADFLIVGNKSGIGDWDGEKAFNIAMQEGKIFSVSNYDWMSRYVVLSVTKIAEEQGEWAAQVALAVLEGVKISDIPIVVNRRWNVFLNTSLLGKSDVKIPQTIKTKAKQISF